MLPSKLAVMRWAPESSPLFISSFDKLSPWFVLHCFPNSIGGSFPSSFRIAYRLIDLPRSAIANTWSSPWARHKPDTSSLRSMDLDHLKHFSPLKCLVVKRIIRRLAVEDAAPLLPAAKTTIVVPRKELKNQLEFYLRQHSTTFAMPGTFTSENGLHMYWGKYECLRTYSSLDVRFSKLSSQV